jgi:CheY-like chemotaxis protein
VAARSDGLDLGAEFVVSLPLASGRGSDGAHGEVIEVEPRDIVLIDDNLDAAQTLADVLVLDGHRVRIANVRLIALTGYAQPEDRDRAKEVGFDAHLAKPADPQALARVLSAES